MHFKYKHALPNSKPHIYIVYVTYTHPRISIVPTISYATPPPFSIRDPRERHPRDNNVTKVPPWHASTPNRDAAVCAHLYRPESWKARASSRRRRRRVWSSVGTLRTVVTNDARLRLDRPRRDGCVFLKRTSIRPALCWSESLSRFDWRLIKYGKWVNGFKSLMLVRGKCTR